MKASVMLLFSEIWCSAARNPASGGFLVGGGKAISCIAVNFSKKTLRVDLNANRTLFPCVYAPEPVPQQ